MTKMLSPEVTDLLHHVELTEAGWPQRLWEQLALSVALQGQALTEDALVARVLDEVGDTASRDQISSAIRRLAARKSLIYVAGNLLTASQAAIREVEESRRRARSVEESAREQFESLREQEGLVDADATCDWTWFCSECLEPLVSGLGARTHELLSGLPASDVQRGGVDYLRRVKEDVRPVVRRVVERFLSSREVGPREFILRVLHMHFLTMAASLSSASLEKLQAASKSGAHIKVLLDTNIVFSALDLHENPANAAVTDLLALLKTLPSNVRVSLYVATDTVDEAMRTLRSYESLLGGMYVSPSLGSAAARNQAPLSGIAQRFFRAAESSKHRLSIKDFLGPYMGNLVTVLRSRSIELYNENTEKLRQRQEVIDDIVDEFEREKRKERGKGYEAVSHDVTLWHLASKQRPAALETPLDSPLWVVTADHAFMMFDRRKRGAGSAVPLCISPALLLQMLQFWVPRTAALDAALVASVKSLLPQAFDSDAEEMSLKIVRALARFENVDDLPEETIATLLVDRALRQRLSKDTEPEEELNLVREAIVDEAAAAKDLLAREQARLAQVQSELQQVSVRATSAETFAEEVQSRRIAETERLERELEEERAKVAQLQSGMSEVQAWVEQEQKSRERDALANSRSSIVWQVSVVGVLLVVVGIAATWVAVRWGWARPWRAGLVAGAVVSSAGLALLEVRARVGTAVQGWELWSVLMSGVRFVVGGVLLGLVVNLLTAAWSW